MPSPILAFLLLISFIIAISALPVPFVRIDVSASPPVNPFSPPANFFDIRQQQKIIEDTHADAHDGRDVRLHITMSVDTDGKESEGGLEEESGKQSLSVSMIKRRYAYRSSSRSKRGASMMMDYMLKGRDDPVGDFTAGFSS